MQHSFKSFLVGACSGAITYASSIYALGFTSAFAMPRGLPIGLWLGIVVFGPGAVLVAFVVHFLAVRTLSATPAPAFLAFVVAVVAALAATGSLPTGLPALTSWVIGALLASVAHSRLRPDKSFKPNPLRPSA